MPITVASSFPRVHTTGAIHNFVEIPADPIDGAPAVAYYYLGTCELQPEIDIRKVRLPVKNDLAGKILPFQKIEQGEEADIGMVLNRVSLTAYGALLALPQGNANSTTAGAEGRYHRGQLTYGLHTWGLIQVFDWYGQTFPGADKLIQGYYWPTVELIDHKLRGGTQDLKLMLAVHAVSTWNTSTSGFNLYSTTDSKIADALATLPGSATT